MRILNAKVTALLKGRSAVHVRSRMGIALKAKCCVFAPIKCFGKPIPGQRNA